MHLDASLAWEELLPTHCNQGTNFVGAKNEFREALKQCDMQVLEAFLADK